MVSGTNNNYINACESIKEIITPELREKLENKTLLNNDITAIVNSVFIQENEDGSFSVKRKDFNEHVVASANSDIIKLRQEINLIRKICSANVKQPVQIIRNEKRKLDNEEPVSKKQKSEDKSVSIVRNDRKRKAVEQDEQPTKKHMQEKPRLKITNLGDMFRIESEIADTVLGMMAEYIDKSPAAIIGFVNCGKEIPKYLKDNLTILDFSEEKLDLKTFITIISELKNLKSIKLPPNANNLWLESISKYFPNLNSLDVSNCVEITNYDLYHIASNMTSLTSLNLTNCYSLNGDSIDYLFRCLKLQNLSVSGCKYITNEAFKNVQESSDSLQELDIGKTNISNIGLNYIIDGVKGIRRLSLNQNSLITNESIDSAIRTFEDLEYLDLSGCEIGDDGLVNLNQRHKSLQTLKLERCRNITGTFLMHVDQNFEVLKEFSIANSNSFVLSNLNYMVGRFPVIENLDLESVFKLLEEEVIIRIVQGAKKLERLNLSRSEISDEGLICIANQCQNLKILLLERCKKITKIGMEAIFNGCTNLQELDLTAADIDDDIFESIVKKPCKLIKLNVLFNKKLTPIGFKHISKGCPDLKFIDLQICVTTNGILSTLCFNNKDLEIKFH